MQVKRILRAMGIAFFWLACWQALSLLVGSPFLLPSPLQVLRSLVQLVQTTLFWRSTLSSLLRVAIGYLLAVLLGTGLGALCAASRLADALLRPIRSIIKATPVVSFILLVQLWMFSNAVPAFMAFLMVLPLVWGNVQEGVYATDAQLLEMAKLFRFGRGKTLRLIYLPSVMPQLLAACATGFGFAWKASVAAEVLARTAYSIGKYLVESKSNLRIADMFAWTAVVVILSVVFERLLVRLLQRIRSNARWGVDV